MKRKLHSLLFTLLINILIIPNVLAADPPSLETIDKKSILLANGTAITIEESNDPAYTALVKWEDGEILIPANTTIFGGYHYNVTDTVDTSITMNGGTVKNIMGGGLHQSKVGNANIVVNGGTVTGSIMGGGYDGFTQYAKCSHEAANLNADLAKTSTVKTESANITINGGNLNGIIIYGGGGGYSYTGKVTITINKHTGKIAYLISGGSNGYTGEAKVTVNDGNINIAQSVNRGTMDSSETTVNGGTVDTLYVGGENDPTVTGTIASSKVNVTAGEVTNLEVGSNGVNSNDNSSIPATDIATIEYKKGTVTNIDKTEFQNDAIKECVNLTIHVENKKETISIEMNKKITEEELKKLKEEINKNLIDDGFKLENLYADENLNTKFDFSKEITEDKDIYVYVIRAENSGIGQRVSEKQEKAIQEETATPIKISEKNPDTADLRIYTIIISILIGIVGLTYIIKQRFFS